MSSVSHAHRAPSAAHASAGYLASRLSSPLELTEAGDLAFDLRDPSPDQGLSVPARAQPAVEDLEQLPDLAEAKADLWVRKLGLPCEGPYARWRTPEGKTIGVNFGEHTVVLTGVRADLVLLNDPLGGQRRTWTRAQFEELRARLGRRALGS